MKRRASLLLALLLCAWTARAGEAPNARPSNWATPVTGTTVANLYRVESGLYRGAQPNAAGFQELARLGVRTVLDLAGGDGDGPLAGDESLKLFHVPMSAWGLHDDLVLEALRIMTEPENRPLMVHCRHGADRTGAMVALYRVVVQGWSKEKAVREMDNGGYNHSCGGTSIATSCAPTSRICAGSWACSRLASLRPAPSCPPPRPARRTSCPDGPSRSR
jgi:tyrosine-protein phosphatase SIW14